MFCQVGESEYALFVPYISTFTVNPQIKAIIRGALFKNFFFFFEFLFQTKCPMHLMCRDDYNQEPQLEENNHELKACDANLNTIFQIQDEVSPNPLCS